MDAPNEILALTDLSLRPIVITGLSKTTVLISYPSIISTLAVFTYVPANRGLVTITAVSGNDVSNPLKILDYDLRAVTDVDVSNGKLIVDSISSTEMTNNTKFVVDIDYSNGKLEVIKDNINIDFPESIVSEITIDEGILVIRDMQDVLRWA